MDRVSSQFCRGFRRLVAGATLVALVAGPVLPMVAGATVAVRSSSGALATLGARTAVACGSETIQFSPCNQVLYNQIHATDVSCAIAKEVVRLGGRHDGAPPKGWLWLGSRVVGSNCAFSWHDGKKVVTGFTVDDAGC
ncbi:MAG: hypothetical protein WA359_09925 [Acidimicrobiales bacterium]